MAVCGPGEKSTVDMTCPLPTPESTIQFPLTFSPIVFDIVENHGAWGADLKAGKFFWRDAGHRAQISLDFVGFCIPQFKLRKGIFVGSYVCPQSKRLCIKTKIRANEPCCEALEDITYRL